MKLIQAFKVSLFVLSFGISNSYALETVDTVDVGQYLGRWYQISRNPLPFEPLSCVCAQQTLSLVDSTVQVYNSCNVDTPQGPIQEIRGTAESLDPISNSKFVVDFGLPVTGQYWIIGLATDYSWAVVSDPSLRSLYILSKTPLLASSEYDKAVSLAEQQMDVSKLKITDHTNCTYPE